MTADAAADLDSAVSVSVARHVRCSLQQRTNTRHCQHMIHEQEHLVQVGCKCKYNIVIFLNGFNFTRTAENEKRSVGVLCRSSFTLFSPVSKVNGYNLHQQTAST